MAETFAERDKRGFAVFPDIYSNRPHRAALPFMPVFRDMPDELEEFVHFSTSCAHTLSLLTTSRLGHQVKCVRIEKTLDELIRSGIARFYLAEKKVIGELINFSRFQQPRAKKS